MLAQAYIVCRSEYEPMSQAEATRKAYATGPYKLVEWRRDDRLTLARNPMYTPARAPFERVIFRTVPEASTRAAELIAGNVDLITNVAPDQVSAINASGTAVVHPISGTRRIFVGFNLSPEFAATPAGAPLQKKEVRQALEYAVDVPMICEALLQFPCKRMSSPIELQHTDVPAYPYDPDKTEKLLDAAGYPRGKDGVRFRVTLQSPHNRYLEDENVAQAVSQFLGDIGVQTTVQTMDFNSVFAPRARQHQVGPLFFMGNGGAMWSPFFEMSLFPTKMANTNTGEWLDARWTEGLKRLESIRDPVQERAELRDMEEVFRDDAPWLFLYFQPDFYASSTKIQFTPRRDELIDVMSISPKR
jgi:peptide/nickel transport system substrate-binding protein